MYDNAADAFSVDDSVADDDLVSAVQYYENSSAPNDLSGNNNINNSNSNINIDEKVYCPLTDDDIITATRKFNILTNICSSPLRQFIKQIHNLCNYVNKLNFVHYLNNGTFIIIIIIIIVCECVRVCVCVRLQLLLLIVMTVYYLSNLSQQQNSMNAF